MSSTVVTVLTSMLLLVVINVPRPLCVAQRWVRRLREQPTCPRRAACSSARSAGWPLGSNRSTNARQPAGRRWLAPGH